MKKFTSLFALLSCLCVVSAQAYTGTAYVYASYPNTQFIHWEGASVASVWEGQNQAFSSYTEGKTIDGDFFHKITLESKNDETIKLWFHDSGNGQTTTSNGIVLSEGEHYFFYFGDNNYYTTCPISVKIGGKFYGDSWSEEAFVKNSMTNWTYTLTPTVSHDFDFGITSNDAFFTKNLELEVPQGLVSTYDDNNNLVLNHNTFGRKYKFTATWTPGSNFTDVTRWKLKIEAIDTYTVGNNTYDVTDNNVLTLTDGSAFSATGSFTASTATYSRSSSNEWGTLCLPFEIKNSYDDDGVTFYSLSDVDETNKVLTFTPIEGAISAGEPVVYKSTSKSLNISETGVNVVPIVNEVSYDNGWTLYGSFVAMSNVNPESGKYLYYIANDQFYKSKENANVPAYRAYFIANVNLVGNTSQAPIRIEVADSENIQFVEQEDGTVKAYYDLQGRKLDSARKGLVIENGKIIMVK